MTKEVTLYTGETIYRPFWEKDSALLEVELGCGWHRCKFCDFARDPLFFFSMEEIEAKARLLVPFAEGKKRIFLLGENPFMLSAEKLFTIFGYIEFYMPWIEEISMYARFDDILQKTPEELLELRHRKLVHLHIGLESGCEKVLALMDKGVTARDGRTACHRLQDAGITYALTAIPGLGGTALTEEHIADTVDFLNDVQPKFLWLMGLKVWPNTPLEEMCRTGVFTPLTLEERLLELHRMVEQLNLTDCQFADTTVLNKYTLAGHFPEDKGKILYWTTKLLGQPQ